MTEQHKIDIFLSEFSDKLIRAQQEKFSDTFDEEEAAEYLKISVGTLRYYALRVRELAFCRVGRNLVFRKEDLDDFLSQKRVPGVFG